jgi:hypothetical protein
MVKLMFTLPEVKGENSSFKGCVECLIFFSKARITYPAIYLREFFSILSRGNTISELNSDCIAKY